MDDDLLLTATMLLSERHVSDSYGMEHPLDARDAEALLEVLAEAGMLVTPDSETVAAWVSARAEHRTCLATWAGMSGAQRRDAQTHGLAAHLP